MTESLAYIVAGLRPLAIPIDSCHPDPANARKGHAVDRIAGSLALYGQRKAVVVNASEGNKIEAGNGTWLAAKSLGWSHIAAVIVEDDPMTAVGYGIADNRLGHLSEWDAGTLAALLDSIDDDLPTGFEGDELEELLAELGAELDAGTTGSQGDAGPQIDRAEELRQVWRTELGQLWQIGEHRLICGDCTDRAVVERAMGGEMADTMITDPPYAIYGSSTGIGGDITDNNMVKPFIREVLRIAEQNVKLRGHTYIFCDWRSYATWWDVLNSPNHKVCNCIVWDKGDGGLGAMYTMRHEFIVFGEIIPKAVTMTERARGKHRAVNGLANVMRFNVPQNSDRLHNAAKPVDLLRVFVGASSDQGQLIIEPFAGSGTTLVACQNLSRRCRAIEISPAYCAVILQRMSDAFPGIDIRQVT